MHKKSAIMASAIAVLIAYTSAVIMSNQAFAQCPHGDVGCRGGHGGSGGAGGQLAGHEPLPEHGVGPQQHISFDVKFPDIEHSLH